jgi:hypothetical protein
MGDQEYLTRFGHLGRKELVAYAEGEELGARSSEHLKTCLECQSRVANLRVKSLWKDHPETEIFRRYAEGDLPPDEVKVFDGHVAACAPCQELLTSVTDAEKLSRENDMSSSEFEPPRTLPPAIAEELRLETSEAGTPGEEDVVSLFSDHLLQARSALPRRRSVRLQALQARPQKSWAHRVDHVRGKASLGKRAKDRLQEVPDWQGVWQVALPTQAKGTRFARVVPEKHGLQRWLWKRNEAKGQEWVFDREAQALGARQKDTLTAQEGNLQCAVRVDAAPDRTGAALTVSVSHISSGISAPGILVVLHSTEKIVDRVTDTEGRVVFPSVTGSVTLQFGSAKFSLELGS